MAKWIGVDLDGTIAKAGQTTGQQVGAPVMPMVRRVRRWLRGGQAVRIVTARKLDRAQIDKIKTWLSQNQLSGCAITNSKDLDMLELWDDNAIRVERNAGEPCTGCRNSRRGNASAAPSLLTMSESDEALTDC